MPSKTVERGIRETSLQGRIYGESWKALPRLGPDRTNEVH